MYVTINLQSISLTGCFGTFIGIGGRCCCVAIYFWAEVASALFFVLFFLGHDFLDCVRGTITCCYGMKTDCYFGSALTWKDRFLPLLTSLYVQKRLKWIFMVKTFSCFFLIYLVFKMKLGIHSSWWLSECNSTLSFYLCLGLYLCLRYVC